MADEYSISQLTEDVSADDSDLLEVAKDNGDGTFTSRKQLRSTLLSGKADQADLDTHEADTSNPHSVTAAQVGAPTSAAFTAHASDISNPHSVTKAQVGLGDADNTSDSAKPVSTATQSALDGKADADHTHDDRYYTESEVNTALAGKSNTDHNHTASDITDFDTEVANNAAVTANTAKNSYPSADATKLAGIEAGAEVNEIGTADIADFETTTELNTRDTANRSRTNHTGTQAISTVTGLQTALDSKADDGHTHDDRYYTETETDTLLNAKADAADVPATIVESVVAGTNVTVDNTDPANPVVSASGGGGEGGGAVDSVNGETGVVVLDADDIDDSATTNKFATAAQLANADSAVQPGDLHAVATSGDYTDLTNTPTVPDELADLDTTVTGSQLNDLKTKVDGVESGATADMTGAEIKTAYEAEADTNAYTDAEKTKLAGVEAGAEVNEVSSADIADFETTTELNARDTANRDRTNHTGSQAISTVSGLQDALDAKLEDVDVDDINATGTADDSTYLRGDGTWSTPAGGGGGGGSSTPHAGIHLAYNSLEYIFNGGSNGGTVDVSANSYGSAVRMATGTTTNAYAYLAKHSMMDCDQLPAPFYGHWMFMPVAYSAGDGYIRNSFVRESAFSSTGTPNHIGIEMDKVSGSTTIYSSTADGSTQELTALSGVSPSTDVVRYAFVYNDDDTVDFYADGVLKNTHSTNVWNTADPSDLYFGTAYVRNTGTDNFVNDVGPMSVMWPSLG